VIKNSLTKKYLIENLRKKNGFSSLYNKKLIDDLISVIIQNIKKNKFHIKNIGTFKVINKKERIGRNPKTKEKFNISARKFLSFIVSKKLLRNINK